MKVQSTAQKPRFWRLWHSITYSIGASAFLIASIIILPIFSEHYNAAKVSTLIYIIGSFSFLLASVTEWMHYTKQNCSYLSLSINFFASVIGSLFYVAGSINFIPDLFMGWLGCQLFRNGSAVIIISQIWKLCRASDQNEEKTNQSIKQDNCEFYCDLFIGLGGLMYFLGTFFIVESEYKTSNFIYGTAMYSLGGLFYFLSAIFMQKRYFFDTPAAKGYQNAQSSLPYIEH